MVAVPVVVFAMSWQRPMLLSTGTGISAGSVDGPKPGFFIFINSALPGLSAGLRCVVCTADRRVFDPHRRATQQLGVKVWKMCVRSHQRHPVVL